MGNFVELEFCGRSTNSRRGYQYRAIVLVILIVFMGIMDIYKG